MNHLPLPRPNPEHSRRKTAPDPKRENKHVNHNKAHKEVGKGGRRKAKRGAGTSQHGGGVEGFKGWGFGKDVTTQTPYKSILPTLQLLFLCQTFISTWTNFRNVIYITNAASATRFLFLLKVYSWRNEKHDIFNLANRRTRKVAHAAFWKNDKIKICWREKKIGVIPTTIYKNFKTDSNFTSLIKKYPVWENRTMEILIFTGLRLRSRRVVMCLVEVYVRSFVRSFLPS